MRSVGVDWIDQLQDKDMAVYSEDGNEPWGSIRCG